jgi:hypothetical protein
MKNHSLKALAIAGLASLSLLGATQQANATEGTYVWEVYGVPFSSIPNTLFAPADARGWNNLRYALKLNDPATPVSVRLLCYQEVLPFDYGVITPQAQQMTLLQFVRTVFLLSFGAGSCEF